MENYNPNDCFFTRESGIIMHISSLASKYGIGDFGQEAYDFVDFLVKANVKNWQMLPLGPTSYGDSPYQSFSSFAGNPYFISFDKLIEEGLLTESDTNISIYQNTQSKVDYGLLYENKFKTLMIAYKNNKLKQVYDLESFKNSHRDWVEDYCLFMALKNHFGGASWQQWPMDIKKREADALNYYRQLLSDQIEYNLFMQCVFDQQFSQLKDYANQNQIKIIGDVPIYVAMDSCDVWMRPDLFMLDENLELLFVGGCPPDAFSDDGQLWGNPVYRWSKHDEEHYAWWIERLKAAYRLFDVVRLDHFRGFESFWSIPAGDTNAKRGEWIKGPAMKLFSVVKEKLPQLKIIVEDLGYMTKEVNDFRIASGYPGMRVLLFAFNPYDESENIPHRVDSNWVFYTGTHDNEPLAAWFSKTTPQEIEYARQYLLLNDDEGYVWGMIRGVWSSNAHLAIAQMQDFLGLDESARMNLPNTLGNWSWRVDKSALTDELASRIKYLNHIYRR